MSDQWELFSRTLGENPAIIVYDDGLRGVVNDLPLRKAAKYRVTFKDPHPNGLPRREEFDALSALEDALCDRVTKHGGVYLGRVTVDGNRHFHFLWDAEDRTYAELAAEIQSAHGYPMAFCSFADPGRDVYWQELVPTPRERRVMADEKVIDNLRKHGDPLTKPRRIDHWTYFPTEASRSAFEGWARKEGYEIKGFLEGSHPLPFGLQIFHSGTPQLADLTRHTVRLFNAAQEYLGDYDGWETSVEKDG